MAHIRTKSITGATLLSKMFKDPLEHASRLLRLNYVHPVWWTAYKMCPPKDVYPIAQLENIKLPVDDLVRTAFKRIPMLRKEKYELANPDYSPLAVRFALTQQRLMDEEGLSTEAAFRKCEDEIFKEELYYFAKTIRENPGNYFKLTNNEMNHFYVHDVINEVQHLTKQLETAESPKSVIRKHLGAKPQVLSTVLEERGVKFPKYDYTMGDYARDGRIKYSKHKATYDEEALYDVDAAIAGVHHGAFHENQRYIKTSLQVSASVLLRNIKITDPPVEVNEDMDWSPDMLEDSSEDDAVHLSAFDRDYFKHREILEQVEKLDKLKAEDQAILELLEAEKAAQKQ